MNTTTPACAVLGALAVLACITGLAPGQRTGDAPKAPPVPVFSPAKTPVAKGEVPVGVITITFKETDLATSDFNRELRALDTIKGLSQEAYYKIYSNGIVWPKPFPMPYAGAVYDARQFYGYYCEYDYWRNPMGWKTMDEGNKRANQLRNDALQFATKASRASKPRFLCYNYITTRTKKPEQSLTDELIKSYKDSRSGVSEKSRSRKPRNNKTPDHAAPGTDPWTGYAPVCRWADPLWPNSIMQIHDFSGGALAHEFGHCLGAPDVYHVGRHNDGIDNNPSLLAYGPTANAFSRFYHHAFIKEKNHPTIKTSGTYTLYPRHIDPQGNQAVGYVIPSNHPHYFYQVEYVHGENDTVGVGSGSEGMLISVVNLGLQNFLGSPDYFYVYRPNDPFFRGLGDTKNCLFGKLHKRTEFNMATEPSSRLPNLLDGGVSFKNIQENNGTLTFELVIDRKPVTGAALANSMLPQIRLDEIQDVQATSFTANCTIKFRGEPLKTAYGFCWSTREHPTVKDDTYALAHREWYRGHAINLAPNTTYYLRAFATNGVGVRYSDEEKTVKTLDPKSPPSTIGPLCTDGFTENTYLHDNFSSDSTATDNVFIGYSPTCILAKLIAYHRPAKFSIATPDSKSKPVPINFADLSWNPDWDDFPMRLGEIRRFFGAIYHHSQSLGLHNPKPNKDFLKNLVKLTGVSGKPVLTEFSAASTAVNLVRNDLLLSRPVIIVFAYESTVVSLPIRWALIDGINSKGELHVDFPLNSELGDAKPKPGYYPPAALMFKNYKVSIVTSLYYKP